MEGVTVAGRTAQARRACPWGNGARATSRAFQIRAEDAGFVTRASSPLARAATLQQLICTITGHCTRKSFLGAALVLKRVRPRAPTRSFAVVTHYRIIQSKSTAMTGGLRVGGALRPAWAGNERSSVRFSRKMRSLFDRCPTQTMTSLLSFYNTLSFSSHRRHPLP